MSVVEPIRSKEKIKKIENLLKSQSIRNFVLFKIGINFGLRISDILALNVGDIKDKNFIKVIEKKTKKYRKIPINQNIKEIIKIYTQDKHSQEPLFISKNHLRLDRISAYRIIKKACNNYIPEENVGTHTLRKTFGYHHYKQYKDVAMLQKIFNHSSPGITLRYIGIAEDEIYNSYMELDL